MSHIHNILLYSSAAFCMPPSSSIFGYGFPITACSFNQILLRVKFQFTLPDGDAMPAHLGQAFLRLYISFLIPLDLRHPELPPCMGYLTTLRVFNTKL